MITKKDLLRKCYSKYKGVVYEKWGSYKPNPKWLAKPWIGKQKFHIGVYETEEEAAQAIVDFINNKEKYGR